MQDQWSCLEMVLVYLGVHDGWFDSSTVLAHKETCRNLTCWFRKAVDGARDMIQDNLALPQFIVGKVLCIRADLDNLTAPRSELS